MLEEHEWPELEVALSEGVEKVKRDRQEQNKTLDEIGDIATRFKKALEVYERITGYKETVHEVLRHHRVSLYGPPCEACGKPLRTPRAKRCVACGMERMTGGEN